MVVKEDQERVKTLISDTITLLCRNGLTFKSKFNINALIGITLDEDDVFLLDIKETIKNTVAGLEDSAAESDSIEQESVSSQSRRRKKRKRSQSNGQQQQTQTRSNSDSEGESNQNDFKQTVKQEQEEDDDDDDLVFIKDEPGDPSLQGDENMYSSNNLYQNSQQQQQQSGDILSSLAQQGQLYATPAVSDNLSGPSQWDPSTSQVPFSQASPAASAASAAAASQLNMSGSIGDSPAQSQGSEGGGQQQQPWACYLCKDAFTRMSALAQHHNKFHAGENSVGFMCDLCLQIYPDPAALTQHLDGQHGEACEECGRRFMSQTTLGQHRRMHSGQYRYRCPLCLKGCSSTEQLRGHISSRHNRTEFLVPCPVCNKKFSRRSKMTMHIKKFHPADVNLISSRVQKTSMAESMEPLLAALEKEAREMSQEQLTEQGLLEQQRNILEQQQLNFSEQQQLSLSDQQQQQPSPSQQHSSDRQLQNPTEQSQASESCDESSMDQTVQDVLEQIASPLHHQNLQVQRKKQP